MRWGGGSTTISSPGRGAVSAGCAGGQREIAMNRQPVARRKGHRLHRRERVALERRTRGEQLRRPARRTVVAPVGERARIDHRRHEPNLVVAVDRLDADVARHLLRERGEIRVVRVVEHRPAHPLADDRDRDRRFRLRRERDAGDVVLCVTGDVGALAGGEIVARQPGGVRIGAGHDQQRAA